MIKLKNLLKESNKKRSLLTEVFMMEIWHVSNLLPSMDKATDEQKMKFYNMHKELSEILNKFWKKYKVPFYLRGPKNKPRMTGYTDDVVAAKKAEYERLDQKRIEKEKRKEMKKKQLAGSPKKGQMSAQPRFGSGKLKSKFRK